MKSKELLLYLAIKNKGDWDGIYRFIKEKREIDKEELKNTIDNFKGNFICLTDDDYPEVLKYTTKPPFILFYRGDISLLKEERKNMLSVIGSRNCSTYAKDMTNKLINELPNNICIISGMAKGIDGIAHEAALNSKKKTIAVLGGGFNYIYPKEHTKLFDSIIENGGLVISEYPDDCEPKKENFLYRNRLIATLCKALFVAESYGRSGSSSTVCFALQENRDVCCLPFKADENSNCNKFIKDGAFMVESANDLLNVLN